MMVASCEHAELQKSAAKNDPAISTRTIECIDCPAEDCCCSIQLLTVDEVNLRLCGTSSPDNSNNSCGPSFIEGCEIEGFYLFFGLDNQLQFEIFCMEENAAFSVFSDVAGTFRISCQAGIIGPQSIDVDIDANETIAIEVNGDCEVSLCQD